MFDTSFYNKKNSTIHIERAKDNNYTCRITTENKKIYLYSKYYPKKNVFTEEIVDTDYIFIGFGLGYEVAEVAKQINKKIYIIDFDKTFYNLVKEIPELNPILENENITFLFGEEYKTFNFGTNYTLYPLEKIVTLFSSYFAEVINFFNNNINISKSIQPKIICFSHITIAKDCYDTFKELGYEVSYIDNSYLKNADLTIERILPELTKPSVMFSINYNLVLSEVSRKLNIPYISWTVDTPCYPLYEITEKSNNEFIFIYDKAICRHLQNCGIENVFYMPVAANTNRIQKDVCTTDFLSDISFVGNLTVSELKKIISLKKDSPILSEINDLIKKQNNNIDKFILKDMINDDFVSRLQEELCIEIELPPLLSAKDKIAFLIGREQSYVERINLIKSFEDFDFRVYGNDAWQDITKKYAGYAEHFDKMPEIFNRTKININLTRTFVESGLPMRVFDILVSKGFLLTNYKEGLLEFFEDKKDVAVFHSIDEAKELAKFYLKHDELRIKMIENAYEKIKKQHSYKDRLKKILDIYKKY